jgi:L-2-hydroxyglutarate oxidase LhgO
MERADCIVVGAGVIGLAVARALAVAGREVVVLERNGAIGTEVSTRNSGVIHAGIYYPPGSLKARLCVVGRGQLYQYCETRGVGHRRLGKLIVATAEAQIADLEELRRNAAANGVDDLCWLDAAAVREIEPEVRCVAALLSPSTGIVDAHDLMLSLRGEAEERGAAIALDSPATGGRVGKDEIIVETGGAQPMALACDVLINAAALGAQELARGLAGLDPATIPPRHLAKGHYFALAGRSPFRRLIYPMPERAALGIHVTLDLAGQARFGPDVRWTDRIEYDIEPARAELFYAAIRRYYPDLPDGALRPAYTGIRPKLQGPGDPARDFAIQGPEVHGIPGLVNLYGMESPGLTCCLAIAEEVMRRLA